MRKKIQFAILLAAMFSLFNLSCRKENKESVKPEENDLSAEYDRHSGGMQQTKTFSAEVVIKWLNMQLDMLRVPLPAGTGSQGADRAHAYCGIALYESVVKGMPQYRSLQGQLTNFPAMPVIERGRPYHWAACANATLAEMNRKLFPATSIANRTKMDSLENALQTIFASEVSPATLQRSINFGKAVAVKVFDWAVTDGSANVNPPYVPPVGPGLWVSTAPNFPSAVNPYASQRRLLVPGVTNNTSIAAPPAYSVDPSSPFYAMVKNVYDKSQNLTTAQTAMALYHRDAPGYPAGGHFVAILSQVLSQADAKLDKAALGYVKTGVALHDAGLICFVKKYTFNLVRPITYIRNVMGYSNWLALFNTPGHPEFPSAHAVNGAAVSSMLTDVFGNNFHFTLHTYDYLGLPARSYNSFYEMGKEMADSRVYAGIHYQATCDKSRLLGEKISRTILRQIEFSKDDRHDHHEHH